MKIIFVETVDEATELCEKEGWIVYSETENSILALGRIMEKVIIIYGQEVCDDSITTVH